MRAYFHLCTKDVILTLILNVCNCILTKLFRGLSILDENKELERKSVDLIPAPFASMKQ